MTAGPCSPESIPSPLREVKRAAGDLEIEVLHAAQTGERGVRRGAGPTPEEIVEAAEALAAARRVFQRLRGTWDARGRAVARPVCLACARGRDCAAHERESGR